MVSLRDFAVVGGLLVTLLGCSPAEVPKEQPTRPLKLMEINLISKKVFTFPGEVEASEQAKLAFRVPGQVLKYHVPSGSFAKKGELLVELEPKDYYYKMRAELARFDLAKVKFSRNEVLIKDFLISQEDYDSSKSDLLVAESNYKTAQANYSYTKIKMPYNGIVANTYQENHEYVQAQEQVLSIQSVDSIDVVVDVSERLITPIRKLYRQNNANIIVSFPVQPNKEYQATFKDISTVSDKGTSSYELTLTLPKPDGAQFYPGMSAIGKLELSLEADDLVTKIPDAAYSYTDTEVFIWRYLSEKGHVEKLSAPKANKDQLLSLLKTGDRIVVAGVNEIDESSKVKPWNKERGL